uniref:Insulinoma-associated protein 1 n=1 Tax=Leptobrachium leishanense TaxID=445787 RepID=A0A8C5QX82_9ANUR
MPRGFLVKRSRKTCGSYRVPCDERSPVIPVLEGPWKPLSYSPVKHVDLEMKKTFFKRFLSSPASADSFPVASMEKLFVHPFLTPDPKLHLSPKSTKVHPKRAKVCRKLHFADEVTTSPVLGLKIKAEEPDGKSRGGQGKRPPLGEFICQLCKEQYPDPFALAQHKCSRIVRVEYRCPECDKIFSCPANLASHRRWHKPRTLGADGPGGKKLQAPLEGKENSSTRVTATPEEEEQEVFDCSFCPKRFRRHAYLRKHLLCHQAFNPLERAQHTYPCTLCGVHFPSMDIRDKHRLWHAQIFPCELCPTAFFSAPGLSLHVNKCHSAPSRQDLHQQIPIGPGC